MRGALAPPPPAPPRFAPTAWERAAPAVETGAEVTAALDAGRCVVSAHGDGSLRFWNAEGPPRVVGAHSGAVLGLALDPDGAAVLTGGDDGRFLRVGLDGTLGTLADFGGRWVDHVAGSRAGGLRACSSGRAAHVWRAKAPRPEALDHPSTVGGLAFDPGGGRLAVAHYGGVTVWAAGARGWKPTRLRWAGSHLGVTWSPDGKFLVSTMQEHALHGWRLRDRADMRMSGYPGKIRSFVWAGAAPHLVTSGADEAIAWPFDGRSGPMDRAPLTLAPGRGQLATCVAPAPERAAVFVGFQDGAVLASPLAEFATPVTLRGSTGSEVTAMVAAASLGRLLIGDAAGRVLWGPLPR